MTKEELDKIIDFLELRMIMRKAEGSELNFEETQLIKLCELCSDLTKENKELQERIDYLERSNNRRENIIREEVEENLELSNRIDKAIKMLKINIELITQQPSNNKLEDEFNIRRYENLLKILKGDVYE